MTVEIRGKYQARPVCINERWRVVLEFPVPVSHKEWTGGGVVFLRDEDGYTQPGEVTQALTFRDISDARQFLKSNGIPFDVLSVPDDPRIIGLDVGELNR